MIWFALIIPVIFLIFTLIVFKNKVALWEPLIPLVVTTLVILFFNYIGKSTLTKDREYLNYYIIDIKYYEDWNEYIHKTCSESYQCGTDSKGNAEYCTRYYDCSYVDYHPEYWTATLNDSSEINISENYYNYLYKKFNTGRLFVNMNRDYHTDDGDMFLTLYPNTYEAFEDYIVSHSYENKIQCSSSIFNFPEVDTSDIKFYGLYDYPKLVENKLNPILSRDTISENTQKLIEYINGKLGKDKQIRIWVLIYKNKSSYTSLMQKSYWKGGNKNEFIICIWN
jgi:hypothetical protein